MFKISDVTAAMAAQIQAASGVTGLLKVNTVESGSFINMDADLAPWVGVFKNSLSYSPRTIGGEWQIEGKILVVCQAVDYDSSLACRSKLNALKDATIIAILSDETISGNVDIITEITAEYALKEDERESVHFQSAMISISFEARV